MTHPDPFKHFARRWDIFTATFARELRLPQIVAWLNERITR